MIYATSGLVDALLDMAGNADPDDVTVGLATSPADDLAIDAVPAETPVFSDFYLPASGGSVSAVFGVDLGTPLGQTQGRFVSHPMGDIELDRRDDLHAVVFVAVPPWGRDSIAAYDRRGRRQELEVLEATPPRRSLGDAHD
ncbi:MAG: hypothetical protein V5A33_06935 [Halobacteriales archaeon]